MTLSTIRIHALGALAALSLAGCAAASTASSTSASPAGSSGAPAVRNNPADVQFMQGMVPHHAQAVLIAGWAPTHGASPEVQRLCERIVVGQRDEIKLMRDWLRMKGEDVPAPDAMRMRMNMNGMMHDMIMPGMLTDEQLKALDAARGKEFDRLFLQAMIQHHKGAISMVDDLEAAPGSRQDETVFRFSQDVYADQTTEIRVMEQMLAAIK
jgi:uncharacterized protein (DUF305 family)